MKPQKKCYLSSFNRNMHARAIYSVISKKVKRIGFEMGRQRTRARAPPRRPRKTAEYMKFEGHLDAICRAHSHSHHRKMHIRWFRIGERPRRARARRECALICGGANSRIRARARARARRLRFASPLIVHEFKKVIRNTHGKLSTRIRSCHHIDSKEITETHGRASTAASTEAWQAFILTAQRPPAPPRATFGVRPTLFPLLSVLILKDACIRPCVKKGFKSISK